MWRWDQVADMLQHVQEQVLDKIREGGGSGSGIIGGWLSSELVACLRKGPDL